MDISQLSATCKPEAYIITYQVSLYTSPVSARQARNISHSSQLHPPIDGGDPTFDSFERLFQENIITYT